MLKKLPSSVKLGLNTSFLTVNTLALAPVLFGTALLKLIPFSTIQQKSNQWANNIAEFWIANNLGMFALTMDTEYVIPNLGDVSPYQSYFVSCNHQSWTDIFVLQKVFNRKIPTFRFFLKQELIWVPVIGLCWWALDFPFMKRYTAQQIKKNPSLKGKDKQTTIERCKKFEHRPVSIMNFFEGTRFNFQKHQEQNSPFQYLLKPKAGGAAYALSVLKKSLDTFIDTTIVYPEGQSSFKEFLSGKTPKVVVHVSIQAIPEYLKNGDYEHDAEFRTEFQQWVGSIWQSKDQLIQSLLIEHQQTQERKVSVKA